MVHELYEIHGLLKEWLSFKGEDDDVEAIRIAVVKLEELLDVLRYVIWSSSIGE